MPMLLRSTLSRRARTGALYVAAALVVGAPSLSAQRPSGVTDPRFQPWVGCWSVVTGEPAAGRGAGTAGVPQDPRPARACVVPSERVIGSVDVVLFGRDSVLSRTPIPLPGTDAPRVIDDCTGTETSEFLANDTRLVLRASLRCARGIERTETGLMSIAPNGEWLQLQHQQVAGNAATTVARLRYDAEASARLAALAGAATSSSALRLALGGTVTSLQVLAVAKAVPVPLAEAYVAELGLQFRLDGRSLAKLADAGMPPRVIDLMVAMAHPETFQVGPSRSAMGVVGTDPNAPVVTAAMREPAVRRSSCSTIDDFCYGARGLGAWGLGWGYAYGLDPWGYPWSPYGAFSPYGLSPYGFGNRFGFGYGFGGGWPVYYGNGPVIIVNRPTTGGNGAGDYGGPVPGRAVNGGGYTRSNNPGGGATGRSISPAGGSSGVSHDAGGSASGGAASGGGGGERTAKPRGGG